MAGEQVRKEQGSRRHVVHRNAPAVLTASAFGLLWLWTATVLAQNPVPFISPPLVPASVSPGGPGFTLTVNGANFMPASVVTWNGSPRPTTYVSQSQLKADIPADDIARATTAWITISNPPPGGGTSDLAFLPITPRTGAILFTKFDYDAPPDNIEFTTADFNGDGRLDLASANWHTSSVAIFLGNGDGTFQPYRAYGVCGASGVATGDFNGDRIVDLAVAARGCSSIAILLGNGDGTFRHEQDYDAPGMYFLCVADFDSDGALDLVSGNEGARSVSVRLGSGNGSFGERSDYSVENVTRVVTKPAAADFNGDGRLDLAISTYDNFVAVMLGNGDGRFASPALLPTALGDNDDLAVADLNGDGLPDLAVASVLGSVSVLLSQGDGSFLPYVSYETGGESISVAAADLNGDNVLDLITANYATDNISVLMGNDGFVFDTQIGYPAHGIFDAQEGPRALAVADFNEDGRLDVVVGDQGGSSISVLLNRAATIPFILTSPMGQSVFAGEAVTFRVMAVGIEPLTFQWRRNEGDLTDSGQITGAQTATLNIAAVGIEDSGLYTVLIRNAYGSETSVPASLAVIFAPPTITSQPLGQTATLGAMITLQVQATGSQPLSYQWQHEGVDVMDGDRISGAKTSTLTISELSLGDLGGYSVMLGNALGSFRSSTVELETSSVVLFSALEDGLLAVSWNDAGRGMMLQRTSSVADPGWRDVPGSERTQRVEFSVTSAGEYFRLFSALPPGLLAWWPGDGNALDLAGTEHGTLMNGATFAPGIVGQAFTFDGRDDYVGIANCPGLQIGTGDYSITAWIKTGTPGEGRVFSKGSACCSTGYMMRLQGDKVHLENASNGSCLVFFHGNTTVTDGAWHLVVGVVDRHLGADIYVDGSLDARQVIDSSVCDLSNDVNPTIGACEDCCGQSVGEFFQGTIDDVRIFSRALTTGEIKAIYDAGSAGKSKPSP